jgi:outer membrane protein assembly factor BamB
MMLLTGAGRGKGSALLDLADGQPKVVWENGHLASTFQTGVLVGEYVYGFGDVRSRQPLQCIELRTGELKWSEDLGNHGSLIAADGKLIILDGDGDLIFVAARPDGYHEISRAKVLEMKHYRSYDSRDPKVCWTSPTLANKRVYVRDTRGDLVCVDLSS